MENEGLSKKVTSKYTYELFPENLINIAKCNQRMYILVIELHLKTGTKDYIKPKGPFRNVSVFVYFYMFVT